MIFVNVGERLQPGDIIPDVNQHVIRIPLATSTVEPLSRVIEVWRTQPQRIMIVEYHCHLHGPAWRLRCNSYGST